MRDSSTDPICEQLADYAARYPREARVVARFEELLDRFPNAYERDLAPRQPGHLTGSAWLLSPRRSDVLLTHHRKLDAWFQLGGHADGERDLRSVAWREAVEESGLETGDLRLLADGIFDLDIHTIPERKSGCRVEPTHLHYDVRYAIGSRSTQVRVGPESLDLAWVPIDRLEALSADPSLLRMACKWRRFAERMP